MDRERALKVVLVLVGLIFLLGVYPLMMFLWPSGWRWQPNQPEYEQMILGVYATLGIFLLLASRDPSANRSLIVFTAWSSLVHAAIMTVQALRNVSEHGHLLGDIPALVIVGIALIALAPAKQSVVAVEKLFAPKFAKIQSRQDAPRTTFSVFLDIFYPPNLAVWDEKGVFQHPR